MARISMHKRISRRGTRRNQKFEIRNPNEANGKMSVMPRPLLSALALISVTALGIFSCGYVAAFGPIFQHNVFGGSKPNSTQVEAYFQFGRVAVYWENWNVPPAGGTPEGMRVFWRFRRFGVPEVRRSIWEFDAHFLTGAGGSQVFLLAFPIWCAALPFLIAPLLWLRKRRTPPASAFPVVMPDGHAA
jgi:hypothetical protein